MKTKTNANKLQQRNYVARDLRTPKYRQRVERNQRRWSDLRQGRFKSLDLLGV